MVALNFDASAVQDSTGGFDLIEPGEYRAEIVADEVKESKSTAGNHYLELQVKIDGKGSIWDNLNLWNSNPSAVEIANGTLKQIANAIGQSRIADSAEMLLKPLWFALRLSLALPATKTKTLSWGTAALGLSLRPCKLRKKLKHPFLPRRRFPPRRRLRLRPLPGGRSQLGAGFGPPPFFEVGIWLN